MTISKRHNTIATIENALQNKKSAAIGDILEIIQKIASNASSLSINELADLISRDPTMVERVISSANTIAFKASVPPVLTVSQAIHTIGYEKVRNLAVALVFSENATKRNTSYEQRENAALSVCSGLMAKNLSCTNANEIEPEFAFVCATLRNFGKLLLSSFLLREYQRAKSNVSEMGEDEAFIHEFGITSLDLGTHFLRTKNVPNAILQTIKKIPEEILAYPATEKEKPAVLSAISAQVCQIAFDDELSPEDFESSLKDTITFYNACIPLELDTILKALASIEVELSTFNKLMRIPDSLSPGSAKLNARLKVVPLPERANLSDTPLASEDTTEILDLSTAIENLIGIKDSKESKTPSEIYQPVIQAIQNSLSLEDSLAFIPEESDPKKFSARCGSGDLFAKIKNRPLVSLDKEDIFSICMNRKEDILIEDITAGKTLSVIPDWITENSKANSFVVLPCVKDKKLIAILFGAVSNGSPLKINPEKIKQLREIRQTLSLLNSLQI
ncbi:HDOD domain-containing protein [Puniceicoccaceae bacterium K14]|nr:HDOD domain-containing protein [Puniceicoccaceae bacterium K14]